MAQICSKSFLCYEVHSQAVGDDFCMPLRLKIKRDGRKKTIWGSVLPSVTFFCVYWQNLGVVRMPCIRPLSRIRCCRRFGIYVKMPFFLYFFVAAVIDGHLELGLLGFSFWIGYGLGLGSGMTEIRKQKGMRKWAGLLMGWWLQKEAGWVI